MQSKVFFTSYVAKVLKSVVFAMSHTKGMNAKDCFIRYTCTSYVFATHASFDGEVFISTSYAKEHVEIFIQLTTSCYGFRLHHKWRKSIATIIFPSSDKRTIAREDGKVCFVFLLRKTLEDTLCICSPPRTSARRSVGTEK